MPHADEIKQRIEASIPGARAEVEDYTGGGDHFRASVTAPAFQGLTRIAQHRLVGGCDIVMEMHETGELAELLGVQAEPSQPVDRAVEGAPLQIENRLA